MTLAWRRTGRTAAAVGFTVSLYGIVVAALVVWIKAPGIETVQLVRSSAFLAAALAGLVPIVVLYRVVRLPAIQAAPLMRSIVFASLVFFCAVPLGIMIGWAGHLLFTGEG
jgi:hypothetical protein